MKCPCLIKKRVEHRFFDMSSDHWLAELERKASQWKELREWDPALNYDKPEEKPYG